MTVTTAQIVLAVLLAVAGVALTRFLPFLVFRPGRPTPPFVAYLGKWLGPAVFGLLALFACGAESFMLPAMGGILLALTFLRRKLA